MAISILAGFFVFSRLAQRKINLAKNKIFDLFFYLVIFGIVGARLYYILSGPKYFFYHPGEMFFLWQGGIGIYGALAAGLIVLYFFSRRQKISFLNLSDCVAPAVVLGQAIGRWGNYFNQEVYGRPTNLPWGIPVGSEYFHPTFLYESIFDSIIFLFLIFLGKKQKNIPGEIFSWYLILYPLGRFFIEFLRIDQRPILFGLKLAQFFSLGLFIGGLLLGRRLRAKANAQTS
jgi:prolipoprotein diacylglyceryl transferase